MTGGRQRHSLILWVVTFHSVACGACLTVLPAPAMQAFGFQD